MGYIGTKWPKYNRDFQQAVENLQLPPPTPPTRPGPTATPIEAKEWEFNYKAHQEKEIAYDGFRSSLYSVLLGQCTELLKDKLKATSTFPTIQASRDGIALLSLIKTTTFTYDSGRVYTGMALDRIRTDFYTLKRHPGQSVQSFYEVFRAKAQLIDEMGIVLYDQLYVDELAHKNGRTGNATEADRNEAQTRMIANRFIRACQQKEYEAHLHNNFLDQHNIYPATLADARAIIDARMGRRELSNSGQQQQQQHLNEPNTGTAFATQGESNDSAQNNNETQGSILNLPNGHSSDLSSHSFSITPSQAHIAKTWVLLDNQSTVHLFSNPSLLKTPPRHTDTTMHIHGHGGHTSTTQKASVRDHGDVWFHPNGWVNILSFHLVKKQFEINYNAQSDEFHILHKDTLIDTFHASKEGLYYSDWSNATTVGLVTTIASNKARYTTNDVERAYGVRSLQIKIGRPSDRELAAILDRHMIPNCPYTSKDVLLAAKIIGPDIGTLKGKTVRKRPVRVDENTFVDIPIPDRYRDVTMSMDVLHVNGVPLLATISRHIRFGTITALKSLTSESLLEAIKHVVGIYRRGNLRPRTMLADGAFDNDVINTGLHALGMRLNPSSREEHVGEIERYIRTIKDRMRCTYNTLPFERVPKVLVIEMAKAAVYLLNAFPKGNGIFDDVSPKTIVTGQQLDFHRHCQFEFGQYVQTHEPHDNSMTPRTQGGLALRPTGNQQGGYYFLNLLSGRVISCNHATVVPMPESIPKRVEQLALAQEAFPGLAFGDRDNRILALEYDDAIDDDEEYVPDMDQDEDLQYDEALVDEEIGDLAQLEQDYAEALDDGVEQEMDDELVLEGNGAEVELEDLNGQDGGMDNEDDAVEEALEAEHDQAVIEDFVEQAAADLLDDIAEAEDDSVANEGVANEGVANEGVANEDKHELPVAEPHQPQQPNIGVDGGGAGGGGDHVPDQPRYNLRTNRERNYAHRYNNDIYVTLTVVEDLSTPQMGMKLGVKMFGEPGVAAVKKEVRQLHDGEVMKAVMKSTLTKEQIRQALVSILPRFVLI